MTKRTVALLSGGRSSEREVSLNSGRQVFAALDPEKYTVRQYDPATDIPRLVQEAGEIDVALIILHGPNGEDGTVQGLLDLLEIPYQGAGVLGSAVCMNKLAAKHLYEKAGLPVPPYLHLQKHEREMTARAEAVVGLPAVVKPVTAGSSIGMSVVRGADQLPAALDLAFAQDFEILVERCIDGTEITAAVIGNHTPEPLPLIEIIPDKQYAFFDYAAKYTPGATREICPARIDPELTRTIQEHAVAAHKALFCRGYSRTDFMYDGTDLFVLETNTIPGMTPTSLFPQAAEKAGISFGQLLDRLIELALEDHQYRHSA